MAMTTQRSAQPHEVGAKVALATNMSWRNPITPAAWAIMAMGVALRMMQYFSFDSLWSDELSIALNITGRGWVELLTTPLQYQQVAPIGFLSAEKLGVVLLGASEAGLRLYPFVASLLALFLFWQVVTRYLDPPYQHGALALFALSSAPLWYARNAKQYSGDIAVVLLLLLLALRTQKGKDTRGVLSAGILGGIAILFSQPAVLLGPAFAGVLVFQRWNNQRTRRPVVMLGAGWCVGALIGAITSWILVSPEARAFMHEAWGERFFPLPWESWESFWWLPGRFLAFYGFFIGLFRPDTIPELIVAGGYFGLGLIGLLYLLQRHRWPAALLIVPPMIAVFASIARLLPLSGRVAIYIAPSLIIFSMAGLQQVRDWLPVRFKPLHHYLLLSLALTPAVVLLLKLPSLNHRQPNRPVLEEVREEWQPGDILYAESSANRAMRFYGPPLGIEPWIEGLEHRSDWRASLQEVDKLRGRHRVWFFFSNTPICARQVLESYLGAIGERTAKIPDPYHNQGRNEAAAHLYALTDNTKAHVNAETYTIPDCRRSDPPDE